MTNFKNETLDMLQRVAEFYKTDDLEIEGVLINAYQCSRTYRAEGVLDWAEALETLGLPSWDYEDGYGAQFFSGFITFRNIDGWIERCENDGMEWWEFKQRPSVVVPPKPSEAKARPYQLLNTTPHDISVIDWFTPNKTAATYPAQPLQIRVEAQYGREGWVGGTEGVALLREKQGEFIIDDPKDQLENANGLIVTKAAATEILRAQSDEWREFDIFIQGDPLHDDEGRVLGVCGLIQVKRKGE